MIARGLVFLAAIAVLVSGALLAPGQSNQLDFGNAVGSYSVKPADQSIVCPGALFRSGGSSGTNLADISRLGSANLALSANGSGQIQVSQLQNVAPEFIELGTSRSFSASSYVESTELRNINSPEANPQGSMVLTGNSSQLVSTDSMKGLVSSSCQQPQNDFWLIGGSTAAGRESLLILSNPTPVDAVADVRIFTDLGELRVSGLSGISVTGQSTTVLSLASFAPTVSTFAIQVRSQGAKLAGWIQHRVVRGTAAQGVELISPVIQASTELVIPGFAIRGSDVINERLGQEDGFDAGHILRVLAPTGADITVQIISSDPEVFGAVFTATLDAGMVEDFAINELGDGNYTIFVTASEPVFATARIARGNPEAEPLLDFAWVNPGQAIISARAVLPASQGSSLLVLGNLAPEARAARVSSLVSGATLSISIPALGTATFEFAEAIAIESDSGVYANVVVFSEGQIAAFDIPDAKNIGSEVRIRFR